jgi:hypothetical protein
MKRLNYFIESKPFHAAGALIKNSARRINSYSPPPIGHSCLETQQSYFINFWFSCFKIFLHTYKKLWDTIPENLTHVCNHSLLLFRKKHDEHLPKY